jgi:MacB-like periplasmic core domain
VLLFAVALMIATGLFFGLYPAWDGARASAAATLKDESGQSSGTRGTARIRRALVCAQVMISAMLLIPTGLFLKSLVNLLHVDLGMKTENVIGFGISPSLNGYKGEQNRALFERAEQDLAAIPGVRGVALAMVPLLGGDNWGNSVEIEGRKKRDGDDSMVNEISAGYFAQMGIPLISGREFSERDNAAAPKVAIVNQQFVKEFLERRNPLGIHFTIDKLTVEIVGVVRDSHYSSVKDPTPPVYFTPWRQDDKLNGLHFYVRSAVAPGGTIAKVRRVMHAIDANLPLEDLRTLDQQIHLDIRQDQMVLQLAAAFAFLATALAMLGLYGVMANSVTRRTREIGVRIRHGFSGTSGGGTVPEGSAGTAAEVRPGIASGQDPADRVRAETRKRLKMERRRQTWDVRLSGVHAQLWANPEGPFHGAPRDGGQTHAGEAANDQAATPKVDARPSKPASGCGRSCKATSTTMRYRATADGRERSGMGSSGSGGGCYAAAGSGSPGPGSDSRR